MESLESRWQQLNLSNDEDKEIIVDIDKLTEEIDKGKKCIIGKLHSDRIINKEVLRNTMLKIQKTTNSLLVLDINPTTFIFSFENKTDKDWVMSQKPWLFESSLLSLKEFDGFTHVSKMEFLKEIFWVQMHDLPIGCLNVEIGTHIGSTIGEVKACDADKDGSGWEKALRVLIEMDLQNPIPRGRTVRIHILSS